MKERADARRTGRLSDAFDATSTERAGGHERAWYWGHSRCSDLCLCLCVACALFVLRCVVLCEPGKRASAEHESGRRRLQRVQRRNIRVHSKSKRPYSNTLAVMFESVSNPASRCCIHIILFFADRNRHRLRVSVRPAALPSRSLLARVARTCKALQTESTETRGR